MGSVCSAPLKTVHGAGGAGRWPEIWTGQSSRIGICAQLMPVTSNALFALQRGSEHSTRVWRVKLGESPGPMISARRRTALTGQTPRPLAPPPTSGRTNA